MNLWTFDIDIVNFKLVFILDVFKISFNRELKSITENVPSPGPIQKGGVKEIFMS